MAPPIPRPSQAPFQAVLPSRQPLELLVGPPISVTAATAVARALVNRGITVAAGDTVTASSAVARALVNRGISISVGDTITPATAVARAFVPAGVSAVVGIAPAVTTGAPTSLAAYMAQLNGTVNPEGLTTTYHFEWGTDTSYGNTTGSVSAGSGTSPTVAYALISPLSPGIEYHCRIVATSVAGTSYGADVAFFWTYSQITISEPHQVTYKLADAFTSAVLAELPLMDVEFTLVLNQAGPWKADLNVEDPLTRSADWIAATAINRTCLYVDIDGTLAYGGITTDRTYTLSKSTVSLSGSDHYYYIGRRLQAKDYGSQWASTPAPAAYIAETVMLDALAVSGSLPILITPASATPSEFWIPFSAPIQQRLSVDMIVQQLCAMGYLVGADIKANPIYVGGLPTAQLTLGYPQLGNTPPAPLLVMDVASAIDFTYDENGTSQANGMVEMLSGSGGVSGEGFAEGPLMEGWPLLEAVGSHSSMSSIPVSDAVVEAFLTADLALRAYPLTTATITYPLFDDSGLGYYPSWGEWSVGDDVILLLAADTSIPSNPRFPDGLQFVFRIVKADVKIPNEGVPTVTFTLNIPPSTIPILPPGV